MIVRISRFPALYLLWAAALSAEIQTQHVFDTSVKHGRFEALWHFRIRTKPEGGGLFQVRTGPVFEFDANDRLTFIAGYYFTREQEESRWTSANRLFGGGESMIWGNHAVEIDWRSLLERFILVREPDYFRFRNRFRINGRGSTAPYASVELLVDANGIRSTRYGVGLQRNFGNDIVADFGYFFEDRRPMPAGERHMFSTSFHWRNKTRRIDPDF
jgi:hypothetical protein